MISGKNFRRQKPEGKSLKRIDIQLGKPLQGEIIPPPDKSISHRSIIISSLAEGKSIVRNFLYAEDPLRTLNAFRLMGVDIVDNDGEITIKGKGLHGFNKPDKIIDCGNSGTTMRLLSGVLAGQAFSATLTGDASLSARPMQRIITPLTEMGSDIRSKKGGYPPLTINGAELKPIRYTSPVASAQVKSAILLAGLYCDGVTSFIEPGKSRDHTERMLKTSGADIEVKGNEVSIGGGTILKPREITVPGDFSSAAFFLVAGSIVPGSEILIKNTGVNPTRTGLLDILLKMGADISLKNRNEVSGEPVADIYVKHSSLSGIEIEEGMILKSIDEFPVLCVAASCASGITKITGARELRVKESDRISSMAKELGKMGVESEELDDGLIIKGREGLLSGRVKSYGDHRIAMAMLVAGLIADGITTVEDTECISTSFPEFMEILKELTG
jgi:3-phosphoshikimate 1-carboxyvinyltransferase